MIHHVGLEVPAILMDDCIAFWGLLGFHEVPAPGELAAEGFRWIEKDDQQIHLLPAPGGTSISRFSHIALVDPDLQATVDRLTAAGHAVTEGRQHWSKRRVATRSPAGHRVELMIAAPAPKS